MIFVTVGTELPFDRLVHAMDRWARESGRTDVFAQIGDGAYEPSFISYRRFLDAPEFRQLFDSADLIVSHAGMGTILTALSTGKPVLVMPRLAALNEHRNDHQIATARHMAETRRTEVAFDERQLEERLCALEQLKAPPPIPAFAGDQLVRTLRGFIRQAPGRAAARRQSFLPRFGRASALASINPSHSSSR